MTFTPGDSPLSAGGYEDEHPSSSPPPRKEAPSSLQGRKITLAPLDDGRLSKMSLAVSSLSSLPSDRSITVTFSAKILPPAHAIRISAIGKIILAPLNVSSSTVESAGGAGDAASLATTRTYSHRTEVSITSDATSYRTEESLVSTRPAGEAFDTRRFDDVREFIRLLNDMHDDIDGMLHDDSYTPQAYKALQKLKSRTSALKDLFLPLVLSASSHPDSQKVIKQSIEEILTLQNTYEKTLEQVQKMKRSSSLPLAYKTVLPEMSKCRTQAQVINLYKQIAKIKGEEPNLEHMKEQVESWMDLVESESHMKGYPFAQKKALLEEELMLGDFEALLKNFRLWR